LSSFFKAPLRGFINNPKKIADNKKPLQRQASKGLLFLALRS